MAADFSCEARLSLPLDREASFLDAVGVYYAYAFNDNPYRNAAVERALGSVLNARGLATRTGTSYVCDYDDDKDYGQGWKAINFLAREGFTGTIEVQGSDPMRHILADGEVTVLPGATYYPTDPDVKADTILVSRADVTALLAFVIGTQTAHLPTAVAKLNAALGN